MSKEQRATCLDCAQRENEDQRLRGALRRRVPSRHEHATAPWRGALCFAAQPDWARDPAARAFIQFVAPRKLRHLPFVRLYSPTERYETRDAHRNAALASRSQTRKCFATDDERAIKDRRSRPSLAGTHGLVLIWFATPFIIAHRRLSLHVPCRFIRRAENPTSGPFRSAQTARLTETPANRRNHPASTRIGRSYGESRL
jgi:hypothetical protein